MADRNSICDGADQVRSSSFKSTSCDNGADSTVSGNDDDSVDTYGSIHTFQCSVLDDSPLRKVPPIMKAGLKIQSPSVTVPNDTPPSQAAPLPPPPPSDDASKDDSDGSTFSGSMCTFTSFNDPPKPKEQEAEDKNAPATSNNENDAKESLFSQVQAHPGKSIVLRKSSSLFSLSHTTYNNIEKLYTTTSVHENLALHVRCGYAQRQNNRKYMEDCITVCPSFLAACSMEKLPREVSAGRCFEDFSFFGVFDGHDGAYVSQYLQKYLMKYFYEKLLLKVAPSASASNTASLNLPFNKEFNAWRTSFLEAACKIDREILLMDSQRQQVNSDKRAAAFEVNSDASPGIKNVGTSKQNDSFQDSFAGSTAAVVIVYRDSPLPQNSPSAGTAESRDYVPFATSMEVTGQPEDRTMPPPVPPLDMQQLHQHEDNDDFLDDDVVVGVFTKKDSAANVHSDGANSTEDSESENASASASAQSNYSNSVEEQNSSKEDVVGVFPVNARMLRGRNKKAMQRFSSVDSTYDAPAMELNLDDENALNTLESIINKQVFPFGPGVQGSKLHNSAKRDSTNSNISDLTASYGSMSLLNSSDDLLQHQHAQPFNPKRKSLLAAVRRFYEENTNEDFSKYESFQIEELVDDFLQRASMLDKAASECRGQAAELLQVLQKRAQSSSSHSSTSNHSGSNQSPYMSSLASNSMHSAQTKDSIDDLSDLSPNSGFNSSNKSYSSLGTITSLQSFDDDHILQLKEKRSTLSLLDTVTEGLFESRATSFATSRQASSVSCIGNNAPLNEQIRSMLVGEIASKNIKLLIAHAGDCRVVLCDGGTAIQVTIDHTPLLDEEKWRIKESGGFVSNKRVNGILAVSRSFGDIKFKSFNKLLAVPDTALDEIKLPTGIWNNRHQVISMPDILELEVLSSYEFVIIASDCVWETLTCAEAIFFTRAQLLEHGDSMKAADALAMKVNKEGGMDNCSIIIVNLNQI